MHVCYDSLTASQQKPTLTRQEENVVEDRGREPRTRRGAPPGSRQPAAPESAHAAEPKALHCLSELAPTISASSVFGPRV